MVRIPMAASKLPNGSAPSTPGGRPRAQVSYEGEDEFSTMSLDPSRSKLKKKSAMVLPDNKERPSVNELKPVNDLGLVGLFRKIFPK